MKAKQHPAESNWSPPWIGRTAWRTINDAVAAAVRRHQGDLRRPSILARAVCTRIEALDPLMDALCADTCPSCDSNCCRRATVWYDFKDLLCLHLGELSIPPGQSVTVRGHGCRYQTPKGCRLPRAQRPFICNWFICDAQKRLLGRWPASRRVYLWNSIGALKKGRQLMENQFIQKVTPETARFSL